MIHDGGDVGTALAARLEAAGASVRKIAHGEPIGEVDAFVDLGVVEGITSMRDMFVRVREAALGGAKTILVATRNGELGRAGAGGPAGLVKTLAAEWPAIACRIVDLEPCADPAALVLAELHARDAHVEIGYVRGVRSSLEVVPAEVEALHDVGLDESSVVLVTGGARGITARAAIALAHRYGCRIELVGRSPLPGPEDHALAGAGDARALRSLFGKQVSTPAEIEALATRARSRTARSARPSQRSAIAARITRSMYARPRSAS